MRVLVTGDFDQDGRSDLVTGFGSLLETTREPLSRDCDSNGVPDECESSGGDAAACLDCNLNGVADSDEILAVPSPDADGNGVLDVCQKPRIVLETIGPAAVLGDADGKASLSASVRVHQLGFVAGKSGAASWIFALSAIGGTFSDWSYEGTVAAAAPDGLRVPGRGNSFESTGILVRSDACTGALASTVVLGYEDRVALDPSAGSAELLRFTVEAPIPAAGGGTCGLRFVTCNSCRFTIDSPSGEGGGGCSGPFRDVFYEGERGEIIAAFDLEKVIALGPASFLRGDTNTDGRVDISDAVRILMFLFLGAAEPRCLDTADANDEGART